MKYNNYVFDLYGTLIDIRTDEQQYSFWRKISYQLKKKGIDKTPAFLRQEYHDLIKRQLLNNSHEYGEADVIKAFAEMADEKLSDSELHEFAWLFRQKSTSLLKLYDGVTELLKMLKMGNGKIILLSNAQSSFTLPELRMLGIDKCFDHIFISSDYGVRKPDADFWQIMIDETGIKPNESVMIGNDYEADLSTAKRLGFDTIYIHQAISPKLNDILKRKINTCTEKIMDGDVKKLIEYLK